MADNVIRKSVAEYITRRCCEQRAASVATQLLAGCVLICLLAHLTTRVRIIFFRTGDG